MCLETTPINVDPVYSAWLEHAGSHIVRSHSSPPSQAKLRCEMYTIFHECVFPREFLMSASCSTSADLCFLSRAKKGPLVHERVSHACVLSPIPLWRSSAPSLRPVIWFWTPVLTTQICNISGAGGAGQLLENLCAVDRRRTAVCSPPHHMKLAFPPVASSHW